MKHAIPCIGLLPLLTMGTASGHGDLHGRISQLTAEIKSVPTADLFFRRGCLRLEHGDAMAALADFDRAADGGFKTETLRAEAMMHLGKHRIALNILNRYLEQNPAASRGLVLRARTQLQLGDFAAAIADYQKSLTLTPNADPDLILEITTALEKHHRAGDALDILDHAIARLGTMPSLVLPAVEIEITRGNWAGALRRIDVLQTSAPRPEPWMARRASVLARAGSLKASREAWLSLLNHLNDLPPAERQSNAMSLRAREARQALASLTDFTGHDRSLTISDPAPATIPSAPPVAEQVPSPTEPPVPALTRGPYLQQATPTSMVIRWRTDLAVVGRVNIALTPGAVDQSFDEAAATTEHSVKLTSLAPDTRYYYSVGSPDGILAGGDIEHTFTTPPLDGSIKNTRIWVLGDPGINNINQRNVRDAFYTFTGARTPDLCLLLGDNAYYDGLDTEYQAAIFDTYPTMLRKTPFWSCVGNHDTAHSVEFIDTFPYFGIFTFPTNGEAGGVPSGTEHYYSFDHANIHFISLDSMTASRAPDGAMATWLAADLASTTATWIIAFFHHPPYSKGSHNSDTETELLEMRQNLLPILENGGVDMVLNGHSHSYERSFLLDGHYGFSGTLAPSMKKNPGNGRPAGDGAYVKPLTGPRDRFGAVYNVTGSAGLISGGTLNHPAMCFSFNELGSVVLDINGSRLDSTFLRDNGSIRDTYTILKQGEADSDADGMPDSYEISNALDRHDPGDATLDSDGDGTANLDEYAFGRPASLADVYSFTTEVNPQAGTTTITFPTVTGRTYRVHWSHTLLQNDWQPGSPPITGTGSTATWTDHDAITPTRFYKIEASAAP